MRESARFAAFIGVALVPVACGGAPQSPQPQNPAPVAVGSDPVAVMADGQQNLAPVAEPDDVVAVARWKSPRRAFETVQQWVGMPLPIDLALEEIFRSPGMGSVVAMDAPVELLVALDPKASDRNPTPFIGFSVGMRSVADARQALQDDSEIREVHEGVYRVEVGPEYDRMTCFLAPSLGASASRMVCGPRERDIEALYPYMTRGLPVATMPDSDLHGEIRLGPVQKRYGAMLPSALEMGASLVSHEIGTGDRSMDRAITDSVGALSDELLSLANDLDGLTFDVRLDPSSQSLSGEMSLAFKNRSSWLAQRMFDNAGKAGAPPPIFWSAPAGADAVFFDRGVDGKHYARIKHHGASLIDAGLAHEKFPAADRKAVVDLFERLLDGSPVSVSASGHIDPPATSSKSANEFDRMRTAVSSSLGWQLVGLEEGPARVDGWLRDLARVWSRPGIQRWIRTPGFARCAQHAKDALRGSCRSRFARTQGPDSNGASVSLRSELQGPNQTLHLLRHGLSKWLAHVGGDGRRQGGARKAAQGRQDRRLRLHRGQVGSRGTQVGSGRLRWLHEYGRPRVASDGRLHAGARRSQLSKPRARRGAQRLGADTEPRRDSHCDHIQGGSGIPCSRLHSSSASTVGRSRTFARSSCTWVEARGCPPRLAHRYHRCPTPAVSAEASHHEMLV